MKNNKGFSLVELIVVIAIMAILAAVAIPTFAGFITKANKAADEDFAHNVEYAVELALAAENKDVVAITIQMDKTNKTIEKLEYKLKDDNTTYVVLGGTVNGDKEVAETIVATIDSAYKMKTKDTITVGVVTMNLEN